MISKNGFSFSVLEQGLRTTFFELLFVFHPKSGILGRDFDFRPKSEILGLDFDIRPRSGATFSVEFLFSVSGGAFFHMSDSV